MVRPTITEKLSNVIEASLVELPLQEYYVSLDHFYSPYDYSYFERFMDDSTMDEISA